MGKKNTAAGIAAPLIDIGIKVKDREKIALGLSRVLADTYSLYLKTHNFHWNVEGPMFNTLHLMFMDQYTELWNALDAHRGTHPLAGLSRRRAPARNSRSSPPSKKPKACPKRSTWCGCWSSGHEAVARTARAAFPGAEKAGDEVHLRPAHAATADAREDRVDAAQPAEVKADCPICRHRGPRLHASPFARVRCAANAAAPKLKVALTFDDLPLNGTLPPGKKQSDFARDTIKVLKKHRIPPSYGFINAQQARAQS